MKRHLLLSAVLSVLVAALLGACGGDDDNNNAQTRVVTATTPGPTAPADRGATGTTGNQTKSGSKNKSETAEKKSKQTEKKSEKPLDAGKFEDPTSKEGQDKLSYAAAKQLCRERKLKDLKATYKPKGTSAKAIAKAVSVGYMPKHRAKAAYAGCLAGLKQR
jgi:hypothetical protein